MRRIERLINLVAALLDTRRPLPAEEIRTAIAGYPADNVEAFRRAFERDKADLRAIGIPIEVVRVVADHGEVDAYRIPKESYYMPALDLEPDELAALRLAAAGVIGGDEAETGVLKLALDEPPERSPRVVWGAELAAAQPALTTLYSALAARRRVEFEYGPGQELRTVDPYSLVHRRGHWYLVGLDRDRTSIRSFRVDRIEGKVTVRDEAVVVPDDFDGGRIVEGEAFEIGEEQSVATVRFDADLAWWPEQNLPGRTVRRTADGGTEIYLEYANQDALVSWIVGFGGRAEVVAPEEARAAVGAHVAPLADPARGS